MLLKNKNEVFSIKKTSGLSKAVSKRQAGVFPFFDRRVLQGGQDDHGNFRGKKAWKKRDAEPY